MTNKDCNTSATPRKALGLNNASGPLSRFKSALSARTALRRVARIGLLTTSVLATFGGVANAEILFKGWFNNGIEPEWAKELCCDHSGITVSSPIRSGGSNSQSLKITYKKTDYTTNESRRAELRHDEHVPMGSERWYKVSIYVPTDFKATTGGYVITQFHDKNDSGETPKLPALFLGTDGKTLGLGNRWDTNKITKDNHNVSGKDWDLGPLPKGRWIDFVYHVKWSYQSDGVLEVFMDGKRVANKTGPNYYNDQVGPNIKIGLYASGIRSSPEEYNFTQQVLYFDSVEIADAPIK